jgi:hypothetical protein
MKLTVWSYFGNVKNFLFTVWVGEVIERFEGEVRQRAF